MKVASKNAPSILSFTLSPISLHHDFVRSRSRGAGNDAPSRVDASNFLMYVFKDSVLKLGREGESEGGGGERKP